MQPWFNEAKRIASLEAEVCFLLQEDFYYGPDSQLEVAEHKIVEPLPSPRIPRHVSSMVRTSEAIGNERELARYYSEVIRLARKHRMSFNCISQYFWLRFWLCNTDEDVHIGFPWYDTFSEVQAFLNALISKEAGQVFWDIDQGWELEIHAVNDEIFARLRDPDYDETHAIACYPRDALLRQLTELQNRTESVIAALSSVIGRDLWTSHADWPTFLADENTS